MKSRSAAFLVYAAFACMVAGSATDATGLPASVAAAPTSGAPPAPSTEQADLATQTMTALSWGDFDELARLYQEASQSSQPDVDGLSRMTAYMNGLYRLWNIGAPEATDAYFENLDAVTAAWLTAHPQSSLAAALRMRALWARAFFYRGGGYSNTVSPQQRALFDRYIQQAFDVAKGAPIGADDGMAHIYLVMTARGAGAGWDTQRALSEDALASHPETFGLWEELLISAEPKWGGSWSLVNRMVLDAAKRQKTPEEGDIMYARLWNVASIDLEGAFFDSPVDWIRLKLGLRDIVTRYPNTALVNDFARLACQRRDRAAAQEMMDRLGDEPDLDRWGWSNQARSTFDQCQRWLREADVLPVPARKDSGTQS